MGNVDYYRSNDSNSVCNQEILGIRRRILKYEREKACKINHL